MPFKTKPLHKKFKKEFSILLSVILFFLTPFQSSLVACLNENGEVEMEWADFKKKGGILGVGFENGGTKNTGSTYDCCELGFTQSNLLPLLKKEGVELDPNSCCPCLDLNPFPPLFQFKAFTHSGSLVSIFHPDGFLNPDGFLILGFTDLVFKWEPISAPILPASSSRWSDFSPDRFGRNLGSHTRGFSVFLI